MLSTVKFHIPPQQGRQGSQPSEATIMSTQTLVKIQVEEVEEDVVDVAHGEMDEETTREGDEDLLR